MMGCEGLERGPFYEKLVWVNGLGSDAKGWGTVCCEYTRISVCLNEAPRFVCAFKKTGDEPKRKSVVDLELRASR